MTEMPVHMTRRMIKFKFELINIIIIKINNNMIEYIYYGADNSRETSQAIQNEVLWHDS